MRNNRVNHSINVEKTEEITKLIRLHIILTKIMRSNRGINWLKKKLIKNALMNLNYYIKIIIIIKNENTFRRIIDQYYIEASRMKSRIFYNSENKDES